MVEQYIDRALQVGDNAKILQIVSIMQNEIDKYDLVNIGKTPISQTKMKFDAQSILEQIRQKAPEVLVPIDQNTNPTITEINFSKLAEKISTDESIGKSEVDRSENQLDNIQDKEASFDD